jgi:hypothetical protein
MKRCSQPAAAARCVVIRRMHPPPHGTASQVLTVQVSQIPARHAVVVPARDEDPAESDSLNECLMNDPAEDTAQPTLQQRLQTALKEHSAVPALASYQSKLSVCHTILLTVFGRQLLAVVKLRWLCLLQAEFLVAVCSRP